MIMLNVWTSLRSRLRRKPTANYWHALLTDPRLAVLLYHADENVPALQQKLQDLRHERASYSSSILYFMSEICMAGNNEILFSYIRTVLEIFILYSIETADFKWLLDDRAAYLSRNIETLSSIGFSESRQPLIAEYPSSMRHCLRVSVHLKFISRVERCHANIIQALVGLSETMCLDGALSTYNPRNPRHQYNSATFTKKLGSTDYYWISMAYCLAIEP